MKKRILAIILSLTMVISLTPMMVWADYADGDFTYSDSTKSVLIGYNGNGGAVTIPSCVKSIAAAAFYGCTSLTSITIPESVTSIENAAFAGCIKLTSITIPSKVTSIEDDAFYGCISLTSITIPSSVTSIGDDAFYECTSLASITM